MDTSIDLEIEIASRGSHFVATCPSFPDAVGAGASEEAAKEALVEVIVVRLHTASQANSGQSQTPAVIKQPRPTALPWMVATCMTAIVIAGIVWVINKETRSYTLISTPPEIDEVADRMASRPHGSVSEAAEINSLPKGAEAHLVDERLAASEPPEANPPLPPLIDYDNLLSEAKMSFDPATAIPAIATLRADALRGVAAAQVRWAHLLYHWGYLEESRAWARKLGTIADYQSISFLASFTQLCSSLGSLYPYRSLGMFNEHSLRALEDIKIINSLKKAADGGSLEASITLAELYRDRHRSGKSSRSRLIAEVERALSYYQLQKEDLKQLSSKTLRILYSLLEWLISETTPNEGVGHEVMRELAKEWASRDDDELIYIACILDTPTELVREEDQELVGNWVAELVGKLESSDATTDGTQLYTMVSGTLNVVQLRKTYSPMQYKSWEHIFEPIIPKLQLANDSLGPIYTSVIINDETLKTHMLPELSSLIDSKLRVHPQLSSVNDKVKAGIWADMSSRVRYFRDDQFKNELAVQLCFLAAELGHDEILIDSFLYFEFQKEPRPPNAEKYDKMLCDVAEKGHPGAQRQYANLLRSKSRRVLEEERAKIDQPTKREVGEIILRHPIIRQLDDEAREWEIRAARQGYDVGVSRYSFGDEASLEKNYFGL